MNKTKLFGWLAVAGLLVNIGLAAFIIFGKPPRPPHGGPRDHIIEKLRFDEGQVAEYDKLIAGHRAAVRASEATIMVLKGELYKGLREDLSKERKDSLIGLLGARQMEIEQIHFSHFMDIKKLCRSEQLKDFEELSFEIGKLFSPHRPPRP